MPRMPCSSQAPLHLSAVTQLFVLADGSAPAMRVTVTEQGVRRGQSVLDIELRMGSILRGVAVLQYGSAGKHLRCQAL